VQLSTGVTILNTKNKNTRKFLSIGVDTTNLSIENVACGPVMNKVIKTILYTFLICFLWITKRRDSKLISVRERRGMVDS
jgi:hypothetical protein